VVDRTAIKAMAFMMSPANGIPEILNIVVKGLTAAFSTPEFSSEGSV
jgi:hypothetical protein